MPRPSRAPRPFSTIPHRDDTALFSAPKHPSPLFFPSPPSHRLSSTPIRTLLLFFFFFCFLPLPLPLFPPTSTSNCLLFDSLSFFSPLQSSSFSLVSIQLGCWILPRYIIHHVCIPVHPPPPTATPPPPTPSACYPNAFQQPPWSHSSRPQDGPAECSASVPRC